MTCTWYITLQIRTTAIHIQECSILTVRTTVENKRSYGSAVPHLVTSYTEHFCWVSGFTRNINNLKDIQNYGTKTLKENKNEKKMKAWKSEDVRAFRWVMDIEPWVLWECMDLYGTNSLKRLSGYSYFSQSAKYLLNKWRIWVWISRAN